MAKEMNFWEWRQEQERLGKAPARGGISKPLTGHNNPVNPGYGMSGPPGNSASYAPTGPGYRSSGMQGLPAPYPNSGPSVESKYSTERPIQPQPWIDDVDMSSNWWSPFEPIWPYGPPYINRPREWDFPVGYNLNYIPQRIELYSMLRGMRASWGVLGTIIATRQDQLLRIPWTIQRKDKPRQGSTAVDKMRKFFKRPDGKLSYSQWSRKLTDDLLVLDAPTIYFARDRAGRPLHAEVLDGATIFPLIDDSGRRPDSIVDISPDGIEYLRRQPAFQQIIKGLPMIDLDESEIMYIPMRPRSDLPMYGFPGTEQIFIEASEAVRKTVYQLNFWADGTIPDLIVTVPKEWTPRQIAMFQAHFDSILSGNLNLKSKVRFLPGDMKPFDIKNSSGESLWSQRDEMLIRLACYAYSVSPTPFIHQVNRSVAQNSQQAAEEEGLYPLMSYWKDDIMDVIIQEKFGFDDIEFVFLPRLDPDQQKQATIHQIQIKDGVRPINEVRAELGLEPLGPMGDVPLIYVGNAVIPLEQAASGNAMPIMGGTGQGGDNPSPSNTPANNHPDKTPKSSAPQRGAAKPLHSAPPEKQTPAHKTYIDLDFLLKATKSELEAAKQNATGNLDIISDKQEKAGNFPKGHIWIQGLNVSIENAPGSDRPEKDAKGIKRNVPFPCAYGYVNGYENDADGMAVDVYIGSNPKSTKVWIIDQNEISKKGKNRGFDEHKCFICFDDLKTVKHCYLTSHFDGLGHERMRAITLLTMDEFKTWLKSGDHDKPIRKQDIGEILAEYELNKSTGSTISASSGLGWYDQTMSITPRKKKKKKLNQQGNL
jgi:hypothetical protein